MRKFSLRAATINDSETIHQIIVRQNTKDYGEPLRSFTGLKELWNSHDFNFETDSLLAFAPNGDAAGFAELIGKEELYIYLAENYKLAELADQLLLGMEGCAKLQRKSTEPFMLYGRASEKNQVIKGTFQRNGYTSNLSFLVMEIKLTSNIPTPQWAEGLSVRRFIKGQDDQATYRADEEASEDKGYHSPLTFEDWAKRMSLNGELFDPDHWFLACEGEEIAGVCLNIIDKDSNTCWVDHLGIRRAWRRKGIGKALLLHTFHEMHSRGVTNVKLSVDSKSLTNAPRLYESVGMQTIQQYHFFKNKFHDHT